MRHLVLTASAVCFAFAAAIVACVGDDPTATPDDRGDAGLEATTTGPGPDPTSNADTGAGGGNSGGAPCDPTKPFNTPSTFFLGLLNASTDDIPMQDQYSPRLSADELTVYYSQYPGSVGTDSAPAPDIFFATRRQPSDPFPTGSLLSGISTPSLETDFSVSSDGLTGFYATNRLGKTSCASATGSCIIKVNRPVVTAGFSDAAFFINHLGEQRYPYAVGAAPNVYYAADTGSTKSWDITSNNPGSSFDSVNGPDEDTSPVVTTDELTLYFASNRGSDGGTGLDIYVATRKDKADPFGPPVRVDVLSTAADEFPGYVSADGCRLYLTRDDGKSGGLNLYSASK